MSLGEISSQAATQRPVCRGRHGSGNLLSRASSRRKRARRTFVWGSSLNGTSFCGRCGTAAGEAAVPRLQPAAASSTQAAISPAPSATAGRARPADRDCGGLRDLCLHHPSSSITSLSISITSLPARSAMGMRVLLVQPQGKTRPTNPAVLPRTSLCYQ
jgi:hypothetical protein